MIRTNPMKTLSRAIPALAMTLAVTLGAANAANAGQTLRFAGNFPTSHSSSKAIEQFKAAVNKSDAGISVQTFPDMQLGGATQNVDQVRSGAIFATWIGVAYLSRIVPQLEAISLPFLFSDSKVAFHVIDGKVGDALNRKLAAKGFKVLGWMDLGAREVTNSVRPIKSADDMKGLKIRLQPNNIQVATFKDVGANPTPMDIKEVYSALQQGVIDGQENPYTIIKDQHFYEVQKYLSDTSHFYDFIVVVANKKRYDALSDKQKKVITDAMNDAVAHQRSVSAEESKAALDFLKTKMTFTHVGDAARKQLQKESKPVYELVRKDAGDKMVDMVLKSVHEVAQ